MNEKNLKPINERTKNEQRKIQRKGGIKSGEVRRARKALKDELIYLLSLGDTQEKLSIALINKALNGDVKAFETIRDTIGEKPIDKQEIEQKEYKPPVIVVANEKDKMIMEKLQNVCL